ncbi:THAP domain-containing protein 2, partial [Frankliniella fusca]
GAGACKLRPHGALVSQQTNLNVETAFSRSDRCQTAAYKTGDYLEMSSKCAAFGCKKRTHAHKFPKDEERRKKWIIAIKREFFKPTRSTWFARIISYPRIMSLSSVTQM